LHIPCSHNANAVASVRWRGAELGRPRLTQFRLSQSRLSSYL
jgi:hypothetical protein